MSQNRLIAKEAQAMVREVNSHGHRVIPFSVPGCPEYVIDGRSDVLVGRASKPAFDWLLAHGVVNSFGLVRDHLRRFTACDRIVYGADSDPFDDQARWIVRIGKSEVSLSGSTLPIACLELTDRDIKRIAMVREVV